MSAEGIEAAVAPRGHRGAVVDGKLLHWSPSQVNKFSSCQRRWYMDKVVGIHEEGTDAQEFGSLVHGRIEEQLGGEAYVAPSSFSDSDFERAAGLATMAADWARSEAIGHAGSVWVVEAALVEPQLLAAGIPVVGYIDLLVPPGPDGEVHIIDWKTRSQLSGEYVPSAVRSDNPRQKYLGDDFQMLVYAAWARRKFPQATTFRLTHVNLRTKGKPAIKVNSLVVAMAHVDEFAAGLDQTISRMAAAAGAPSLADLPPNWNACFDFRRPCPYLAHCQIANPDDFPQSHELPEMTEMSIKDRIAARKAAGPRPQGINPPDAAAPAPASQSVTPPAPAIAESVTEAAVVQPEGNKTASPETGTATATVSSPGLIIYVGCTPTKGVDMSNAIDLESEIARRAAPIAAKAGVVDVREIKYAEGTSMLLASFKRNPPTGIVLAQAGGLSSMVLEVLIPMATQVTKPLG